MQKNKFDISVIITAHHEGRLAHRTMRSLFRSIEYANKRGISTEVIIIMDSPDKKTEDYFSTYKNSGILFQKVDFGDPGSSRNYGVKQASGDYMAFLDADNLFGENWLYEAFVFLKQSIKDIVVHPEYHIVFENKNLIWQQISSNSNNFEVANLLEFNYWDTVCLTKRSVLMKYPYEIVPRRSGFGFEDWHWNCQTLAEGIEHHIVPGTVHFLRVKRTGSQLTFDIQSNRVIRPTRLFEPLIFAHELDREKKRVRLGEKHGNVTRERVSFKKRVFRFLWRRTNNFRHRYHKPLRSVMKIVYSCYPGLRNLVNSISQSNVVNNTAQSVVNLPDWLITEWKAIHEIEPQIFPEKRFIQNILFYNVPHSKIGKYYVELCQLFGKNVSHVFLVPWLKTGGADLVTLNYIEVLVKYKLGNDVVVIATNDTDSPWAKRLPDDTRFIEFGKMCSFIFAQEQELLLTRLLLQMAPHAIHNINSDLGYRIFVKYGSALKSVSNLYVDTYCKDVTEEGKSAGYPFMYLPECFDNLKAVASDNQSFLDRLNEIYAFDKEKLFVHYQPVQVPQKRINKVRAPKEYLDILWAGRIDRQKRPDILEKIARACEGHPFRLHVYGSSVIDTDTFTSRLKSLKNVTYYGGYDGLSSLPTEKYDLFLYTSQWDGLPNILIEAISLGLPIIASNVGGVSELIVNGKTGFLIDPYDDVTAYVDCLRKVYSDMLQLNSIVNNAHELINFRHSWERFVEDLKRFPDYVVNIG